MEVILDKKRSKQRMIFYGFALLFLVVMPFVLSEFRLDLLTKFLAYALVAIGVDLIWGYTGILSLGQGVFFGLGAYCFAMYLKLESTGGKLPDFMEWSGVTSLPWWWKMFGYAPIAIILAILIPVLLAWFLGAVTFRNRIKGAYFSILTQALVIIVYTLFIGQQGYTGGTNGITNFFTVFGFSLMDPDVKLVIYFITVAFVVLAYVLCRRLVNSRFGNVLQAVRDGENRLRFFGYNPATYQTFVFCVSAALSAIGGMLFVLNVGIISPSMMYIVPSIEMVLWVAIGGRGTLIGAIVGAVLINSAKSLFSEAYPDQWSYFLGLLFVVVVVFLPQGLYGWLKQRSASWKWMNRSVKKEVALDESVIGAPSGASDR